MDLCRLSATRVAERIRRSLISRERVEFVRFASALHIINNYQFQLNITNTTSEKLFIPYKASAAVQALKVFPVRPRVLSSWGITLLEKLRAADES